MTMEYRAFVSIPGLPFAAEDLWEPLIEHLQSVHGAYGPVIAWDDDIAEVVLSMAAPSEAIAARDMYAVVADSLRAQGLKRLYPSAIRVEHVSSEALVTAS